MVLVLVVMRVDAGGGGEFGGGVDGEFGAQEIVLLQKVVVGRVLADGISVRCGENGWLVWQWCGGGGAADGQRHGLREVGM